MQNKKRLHRHLLFIYIIYFVVLALGFKSNFLPDFKRGYQAGRNTAIEFSTDAGGSKRFYMVSASLTDSPTIDGLPKITFEGLPENISASIAKLNMQVTVDENFTVGNAFKVMGNSGFNYLLSVITGLSYLVVIVLIALIINSLRISIRKEEPLRPRNITLTRIIGGLIILAELSEALMEYLMRNEAARLLENTSFEVAGGFPLSYWGVITGILFIFMAEVLSIGTQLSEEQKFTI